MNARTPAWKDLLSKASSHAKQGDYDQALIKLKSILEIHPKHEIALGMMAAIYLQTGQHQSAETYFTNLLSINPENALARFQLGMVKLNQNNAQEALDNWLPLLNQNNEFMAHFHSGLAYLQLGKMTEAALMFKIAEQRMPISHPLHPQLQTFIKKLL